MRLNLCYKFIFFITLKEFAKMRKNEEVHKKIIKTVAAAVFTRDWNVRVHRPGANSRFMLKQLKDFLTRR